MKESTSTDTAQASPGRSVQMRSSWKKTALTTLAILAGLGTITAASAAWWYQHNFHASLTPVQLSAAETKTVDLKVQALQGKEAPATDPAKTIVLSEREINGFLEEQGLGKQFQVHLRDGALTATSVLPVEKDVPVLGGHTIRVRVSFNTKLDAQHHLSFSLADLSIGGFSPPNDWIGGIKGLNLLEDLQDDDFFKSLSAGIKDFQVREGELRLVLND